MFGCQGPRQGLCQGSTSMIWAMERVHRLFDTLGTDLNHRLDTPATRAVVAGWEDVRPAPVHAGAGLLAAWLTHPSTPPRTSRAALAAVVARADRDPLARQVAYAAVLPGLRRVAAQLTRTWAAEREEVDQDVAAAGWERLDRIAGTWLEWPDRVIIGGARTAVRDRLRAEAARHRRRAPLDTSTDLAAEESEPLSAFEASDLLCRAVGRGVLDESSAGLIWSTRVLGERLVDVAAEHAVSPMAVGMRRLRSERALRLAFGPSARGVG